MTFDDLKEHKVIYCKHVDRSMSIYNLEDDKRVLFDIDGIRFSNGYGSSWNYKDYGKTWALTKEEIK